MRISLFALSALLLTGGFGISGSAEAAEIKASDENHANTNNKANASAKRLRSLSADNSGKIQRKTQSKYLISSSSSSSSASTDPADCADITEASGDSWMRFSKVHWKGYVAGAVFFRNFPDLTPQQQAVYSAKLPLQDGDYPVGNNKDSLAALRDSNAISVINHHHDYHLKHCVPDLIREVGGLPTHPQRGNQNNGFWEDFDEVLEVQLTRRKNGQAKASDVIPNMADPPESWADFSVDQVAEAVHDEPPCFHQNVIIHDMLKGKYGEPVLDDKVIASRGNSVEFINGVISMYEICTWAVHHVSAHNFAAKWYAGRARPEEVALAVIQGQIPVYEVPRDVYGKLMGEFRGMPVSEFFTAYTEGSPKHPSWPAMHSAASNISFWLQIVLKATDAQICAAMKVDYAVSYARTVAGVHYPTDNIDGLNMGMRTLAKELPKYFAEKFGGDYEYIKKKVEMMLFDWNDVNPTNIKYCQTAQQKNRFNTKPLYGPFFDQYCPAEDGSVTRDSKNAAAHDFTL